METYQCISLVKSLGLEAVLYVLSLLHLFGWPLFATTLPVSQASPFTRSIVSTYNSHEDFLSYGNNCSVMTRSQFKVRRMLTSHNSMLKASAVVRKQHQCRNQ